MVAALVSKYIHVVKKMQRIIKKSRLRNYLFLCSLGGIFFQNTKYAGGVFSRKNFL